MAERRAGVALALMLLVGCQGGGNAGEHGRQDSELGASPAALVRVVQAVPGRALDLSLVGDVTFRDLPFRTVTPYRQLRDNQATLRLWAPGDSSALAEVREMLVDGEHYTVVVQPAAGGGAPRLRVVSDDPSGWGEARSWVRVLPALVDTTALDLTLNGAPLLGTITRGSQSQYQPVPPGRAQFALAPSGGSGTVLRMPAATLVPGHLYTIIVTGSPGGAHPLEAITVEDRMTHPDSGYVAITGHPEP